MLPDRLAGVDPRKEAFSLLDEFKAFAFKGSVIDLAVGVLIGAAFGKIVESLVKNIFMPLLASIGGSADGVKRFVVTVNGTPVPYGEFLADVLNFLIVAAVLFVVIVKFLDFVMRRKQEEAAAPAPTREEALLAEIRDLLANRERPPG